MQIQNQISDLNINHLIIMKYMIKFKKNINIIIVFILSKINIKNIT